MAVTLSKILENRLDKNLGELAFDVAIDKEKKEHGYLMSTLVRAGEF